MRRTNIDELPQLFDVLAGDKSIIGMQQPRETKVFAQLISSFSSRHSSCPGFLLHVGLADLPTNKRDRIPRRGSDHDPMP
ncbi:sugar transferase [Bradyrhizobium genosp. A]|uniref:sugar transferase n=1 Tax=Bradyrhizobium genosp. A TaxID=83626 RepID=UPI003CF2CD7B